MCEYVRIGVCRGALVVLSGLRIEAVLVHSHSIDEIVAF